MHFIFLIVGFVLLIKGADFFVDGSINVARRFGIPNLIIGLTIVAMGTSLPEAVVSVTSALQGANEMAIGNVVGSNIFNLLFVIGACGLIKSFKVNVAEFAKDFWISVIGAIALIAAKVIFPYAIPQPFAILFLIAFAFYMSVLIRAGLKASRKNIEQADASDENEAQEKTALKPLPKSLIFILLGGAAVVFGGHLTTTNAISIAESFGVSDRIIGLTILAAGTSLPEFVTSVTAFRKGETGIIFGNVIGSNVFNILFILGLTGSITPLATNPQLIVDLSILAISSLMIFIFAKTGRRITRLEGGVLFLTYALYIGYTIVLT